MSRGLKLLMTMVVAGLLALGFSTPAFATSAEADTAVGVGTSAVGTEDVGVQGGCDWTGCGTVVNLTARGFYVTLLWGGAWNDTNVKWVNPGRTYGGCGSGTCIDVDGILVAQGCVMFGVINGRVPGYNYPFVWTSGWHKIWTNETAVINQYNC